jgi:hypothetical protein
MKRISLVLVLAVSMLGSLGIKSAHANSVKPLPELGIKVPAQKPQRLKSPLRIVNGRMLNVQSLINFGYLAAAKKSAAAVTNSTIINNRASGNIVLPQLLITFKNGTTTMVTLYCCTIAPGQSQPFDLPNYANVADVTLQQWPGEFDSFFVGEVGWLTTNGGATVAEGWVDPSGYGNTMDFGAVDLTNGVTLNIQ